MFSSTSGRQERRVLAERFHIHTIITCHQPRNFNLSQNTNISESIVVARRHKGPKPPTRFVHLDMLPSNESEVEDLHRCLLDCPQGQISNGWGEVSYWPSDRMEDGDWTPAIWRSPELAKAVARFASQESGLRPLASCADVSINLTSPELIVKFQSAECDTPGSFPIMKSRGAGGQSCIRGIPDEHRISKYRDERTASGSGGAYAEVPRILEKAGHLLLTDGQRNSTARLTAIASRDKYVGVGWMPVTGVAPMEAKAVAVFFNSTVGRVQVMSNASRTLEFPMYRPAAMGLVHVPDFKENSTCRMLADCWERTKDMVVPQFRDGECEVRRLWDEAVADAMGWDLKELDRLRLLLHNEPHVRGLGVNEYDDEPEEDYILGLPDQEAFEKLADEWEHARPRGTDIEQMTKHPIYQRIIAMGEPAVPWLLQRLVEKPDHWFVALNAITGARPVPAESRGRIKDMAKAWLEWGRREGYDIGNS